MQVTASETETRGKAKGRMLISRITNINGKSQKSRIGVKEGLAEKLKRDLRQKLA